MKILIKILIITILCSFTYKNKDNKMPKPKVSEGTIDRVENFKSKYISSRNIDIWLPKDYNANKKYAVLYMHDGQMLFDSSITWNKQEWGVDETLSDLFKNPDIKECIVVGIWNSGKGRHSDYFPQKPFEKLSDEFLDSISKIYTEEILYGNGPLSDNYLKFIVNELKPYIDKNYSTQPDLKSTFVAGSSMGGLISIYAICEYPEIFGGAACLSSHWTGIFTNKHNPIPNKFMDYLQNNLPEPDNHKIYFDYGTETLDSLYEPYQQRIDSIMILKGYSGKNWKTLKFEGADHSEDSWRKRLSIPFTFLLHKN